ncbi:MAG: hypothetical protein R3D65_11090 [Zhengella sp.]
MNHGHFAIHDPDLFQRDLLDGRRRLRANGPVENAFIVDGNGQFRLFQPHVEDQDFPAQERRQFRIHGKTVCCHDRLAAIGAGHADVGETDRRERQQAGLGLAAHSDLTAQEAAGLALELGPIVRPVNERWHQDGCGEYRDDKTTDDDKKTVQDMAPDLVSMAESLTRSR